MDSLSDWAKALMKVRINSVSISMVLIFSFSKITPIPSSRSARIYFRLSSVFLANREMDFVRIRSIFFWRHLRIIRLKSSRFLVDVPEIPSSAKMPAIVHSGLVMILSV